MKNLVMIAVDDLFDYVGYRDRFGVSIQTPNLDRLAGMGTSFSNANAVVPVCAPSRTATLTGQSPFDTAILRNGDKVFDLVDSRTTLPHVLHDASYFTGLFGKVFHSLP